MRKLRLDPESLRVETFDVHDGDGQPGTVHGHSYPNQCDPPSESMEPQVTCQATCAGFSCWQSCNGSCNCPTAGCQPYSAGYTYCPQYNSCIEQCDPITP